METKLKNYLLNFKNHTDTFIENNTECFDSRNTVCIHPIKCCKRKFYNKFYGNPVYHPIPIEFVTSQGLLEQQRIKITEFPKVDSISFIDTITRTNTTNSTARTYLSRYSTWIKKDIDFTNPDLFIKELNNLYAAETTRGHITAATAYIQSLNPEERIKVFGDNPDTLLYYSNTTTLLCAYNMELKKTGEMTPKEKENWITFKELENCLDLLVGQERLVLMLFLRVGALRTDYCTIKINNEDKNIDNYLNEDNGTFVFNELVKTKKKLELKIDDITFREIMRFIQRNTKRDYLFLNKKGNPFDNVSFGNYIKRFMKNIGKNIGIQMIRKIVATEQNKEIQFPETIIYNTKNMGHTPGYGTDYYAKK